MKRSPVVATVALAILLIAPGVASAHHTLLDFDAAVDALLAVDPTIEPPPDDPGRDFVVGGVQDADGFNNGFSAHSGPLGENPYGHLSATNPDLPFFKARERVVCLAVAGSIAAIGLVAATTNSDIVSEVVVLRDGGPGGAAYGFDALQIDPQDCEKGLAVAPAPPLIQRGNILIHDAQP